MTHVYSDEFFDYIERGARRSAQRFAELLVPRLAPESILDVGCGRGAWLAQWRAAGVPRVLGLDGAYVDTNRLLVAREEFRPHDLATPFDLGQRFGLVQSLEVAEHLPPAASEGFVESLVRHGDVVLFSASVPGQGGENHTNERPLEYWRGLFASHGYEAYDFIRGKLAEDESVEPWYRFNAVLYANEAGQQRLPAEVRDTRVSRGQPLPARGDLAWRLRLAVCRWLPVGVATAIAQANGRRQVRAAREATGKS